MSQQAVHTFAALTDCEQPRWKRFAAGALFVVIVALGAAIANVIVYLIASAAGAVSGSVNLVGDSGLTAGLVALTSGIGIALAASTLAVIGRFSRRPIRRFRIVATVVLLLSFIPAATVPGAPGAMILTLLAMHLVAWATSVIFLPILVQDPNRS